MPPACPEGQSDTHLLCPAFNTEFLFPVGLHTLTALGGKEYQDSQDVSSPGLVSDGVLRGGRASTDFKGKGMSRGRGEAGPGVCPGRQLACTARNLFPSRCTWKRHSAKNPGVSPLEPTGALPVPPWEQTESLGAWASFLHTDGLTVAQMHQPGGLGWEVFPGNSNQG